jgi:hypothetical protein
MLNWPAAQLSLAPAIALSPRARKRRCARRIVGCAGGGAALTDIVFQGDRRNDYDRLGEGVIV